jgi:hypothetical protein
MSGVDVLVALALVAGALAALVAGARRGRLASAALTAAAVVAGLWLLAVLATSTGWRDADGWVDCYPSCSALQDATGTTLGVGILVGAGLIVVWLVAVVRGRRTSTPPG